MLKYHQLQILTCMGNIVVKPVLWYCRLLFNFNHYVDLFFGKTLVLQNKRKPLMRHRRPIICCLFFNLKKKQKPLETRADNLIYQKYSGFAFNLLGLETTMMANHINS